MNKTTDLSTLIGIVIALCLVVLAIFLGSVEGGGFLGFLDIKAILIVIGGTFFITMACFTIADVLKSQVVIFKTAVTSLENPQDAAIASLEIAEIARKKGVFSLQREGKLARQNRFFKKGLDLIIDGMNREDAERILESEINSVLERYKKAADILKKSAETAPAMGLIGTLIGLVQMLGNLSDPSSIGPAMAIALLTTLYGAILSYMILSPLAAKVERNAKYKATVMRVYLSTIISIERKENPRALEMLLNALLPPTQRVKYFS